jgi:hypothetical protein
MTTDKLARETLKAQIRRAFASTPRPDNSRLRGSDMGDEPFLVEREFRDKHDWRALDVAFIDLAPDGFATALSFFSAEAFRYFLPAYLLADIDGLLLHSDPAFHLWHGLDDAKASIPVNPRLYGPRTWLEAMSERFSLFTVDEARAIVGYLELKAAEDDFARPSIEQALTRYWRPRLGR